MKKIVVKQDLRDKNDSTLSDKQRNPLSYALTRKFLHRNGELMRRLEACCGSVPNIRMTMEVKLEDRDLTPCYSRYLNRGFVSRIRLVLTTTEGDTSFSGKELMEQEMADYFREIGLANIAPEKVVDMETFVDWFEKQLPCFRDFFYYGDFNSNDYEAEHYRKKQQFHVLEKAVADLQGFDTTSWEEDYRKQDDKEQLILEKERLSIAN